ncbi:MAG: protein translocase subunit SecD [Actinomycetota bacterium]|nr:protein translocase subunit SecD [Actinomycetota bacterium]
MSRAVLLRALVALAVLLSSAYVAVTKSPTLGLDLRGGTQIVLETRDGPAAVANAESTDRARDVLERRVNALGVSEPNVVRSGERRIIVELPDLLDPTEAAEVVGRTAQLTFHPVLGVEPPEAEPAPTDSTSPVDPAAEQVLAAPTGERLRLGPAQLTGEGVSGATAQFDVQQAGGWYLTVDFRGEGEGAWAALTGKAACAPEGDPTRRVAIVLDRDVLTAPEVNPGVPCDVGIVGGSTQITGGFTQAEAEDLAVLIEGGALPVPVDIIEQRVVGPTLGAQAIEASAKAAVIGVSLTALFILVAYRLVGGLAALALAGYGLISYAALLALDATLTLPGLAGFVLAIGMAVDANVLVFERAREEYAGARSVRAALVTGFSKAWTAIIDSNVTTLLAAGLLFFLASGPVRGFGVTLVIGVLASMVSALVVTRAFVELAASRRFVSRRPAVTGIAGLGRLRTRLTERGPDLMGAHRRWIAVSLVTVVLALAGVGLRGLELGVEFTGGRLVEYSTAQPVPVEAARQAVADAGFPRAVVQASGDDDTTVRLGELSNADEGRVRGAIAAVGGQAELVRDELVGPSLGDELRRNALVALAVALLAQLAYLAVRFRWTFGAAAVLAMAHDVAVLIGVFAWLGKPVDGVFLAALLTVIGYSVNDSVVIFDRVRETWTLNPQTPFRRVVNDSLLQTLPRTVNTGIGALFILLALLVLGGASLADFALALLVGIGVGSYSSMLTAAPIAVELEERRGAAPPRPKPAAGRARPRQLADSGARV